MLLDNAVEIIQTLSLILLKPYTGLFGLCGGCGNGMASGEWINTRSYRASKDKYKPGKE